MKLLIGIIAALIFIDLVLIAPWWLLATLLFVGGTFYFCWDRAEMRRLDRERIEPTVGRRR